MNVLVCDNKEEINNTVISHEILEKYSDCWDKSHDVHFTSVINSTK